MVRLRFKRRRDRRFVENVRNKVLRRDRFARRGDERDASARRRDGIPNNEQAFRFNTVRRNADRVFARLVHDRCRDRVHPNVRIPVDQKILRLRRGASRLQHERVRCDAHMDRDRNAGFISARVLQKHDRVVIADRTELRRGLERNSDNALIAKVSDQFIRRWRFLCGDRRFRSLRPRCCRIGYTQRDRNGQCAGLHPKANLAGRFIQRVRLRFVHRLRPVDGERRRKRRAFAELNRENRTHARIGKAQQNKRRRHEQRDDRQRDCRDPANRRTLRLFDCFGFSVFCLGRFRSLFHVCCTPPVM